MKCPVCTRVMEVINKDNSQNLETGKRYFRNLYWCSGDDVWLNLEIPVEGDDEVVVAFNTELLN